MANHLLTSSIISPVYHIICVILFLNLITGTVSIPTHISSSYLRPYISVYRREFDFRPTFGDFTNPSPLRASSNLSGHPRLSPSMKRQEPEIEEGEENELDEALKVLRPMLFLLPFVISAVPFAIPGLPIALSFMTPAEGNNVPNHE